MKERKKTSGGTQKSSFGVEPLFTYALHPAYQKETSPNEAGPAARLSLVKPPALVKPCTTVFFPFSFFNEYQKFFIFSQCIRKWSQTWGDLFTDNHSDTFHQQWGKGLIKNIKVNVSMCIHVMGFHWMLLMGQKKS